MGRNSSALKAIYSPTSLKEISLWAKACMRSEFGDREFSYIQKTLLLSELPGFRFDYLTTSTIVCDKTMMPLATDVLCLDVDDALANNYPDVAQYDDMSPVSYLNSGRAILSDDLHTWDEWMNHPFFTEHCKDFNIARSMTLSFRNPERFMTFLAFEYIGANVSTTWEKVNRSRLELATFPFALAWFYRKGFMDDAALDRRFEAIAGLTEAQLTHIRKYVNSTDLNFSQQAKDLGISPNWLKESIYNVRDSLAHKFDWERSGRNSAQLSLRPLEREFRFFEMLGDPVESIVIPSGITSP